MFELLQYAALVLLGASTVAARPAVLGRQTNSSIIPIVGAAQGGIQPRLEIHDLQQNADQWNIFLLAVQAFQAMDPSDELSWYQIAGIHGVPYVPYAAVGPCEGCPTTGYCTHSSTLFPNWHRAYVALFEQSLQANAIAVANQFTGNDKTKYHQAATSLRMPYWDWALLPANGENPFPQMFTDATVSVDTPSGQKTIQNPLQSYSFGSANHTFMKTRFTPDADTTVRNVTFTYNTRVSLRDDLYTVLTSNLNFSSFATQSLTANRDNPNSIEALHDRVHVRTGGDMAYIPTAAFDPVFFLHHAAVDHAYALWQAAYPDEFMEPWQEVGSSYSYTSGTVEDAESDLKPFRSNTRGGFWSPDALRNTTALNYVYADLQSGQSAAELINSLYGSDGTQATKRDGKSDNTRAEYIANIQADSMGSEDSFTVFFFDADIDEDNCTSWHNQGDLMATHSFFTGPEKKGDGKVRATAGTSLTGALRKAVAAGKLDSLDNDDVTEYLKSNLRYRVRLQQGKAVDAKDIPGFEVKIMTADVEMPRSRDQLPVWSRFRELDL